MRIALAAEDSRFVDQVTDLLRPLSRELLVVHRPTEALQSLKAAPADLLIVVEPFFEESLSLFLKKLREDVQLRGQPVLCLHPRAAVEEGVACLDAGADDFMNRPFNAQIFLARVRTLLRRRVWSGALKEDQATAIQVGPLAIKLLERQALVDGAVIVLTRLEFDLLAYLVKHPEQVFKREELLTAVWNYPGSVETRTLDKHVEMLRRKLGPYGASIETIHGVGYRFVAPAKPKSKK